MQPDTKLHCFADQVDIRNSYTPKDLDEESYGLTRSPTKNEMAEYVKGLESIITGVPACNKAAAYENHFLEMLRKLTKGCE